MKFRFGLIIGRIFVVVWFWGAVSVQAQHKVIRLRNEFINTSPPARGAAARSGQGFSPAASGLYLIQFTEPFDPAWRAELQGRNVELLRYVPEDAFVARLNGARLDDLASLPYVQWIGAYRPGHKIEASLLASARRPELNPALAVTVLLSPAATAQEMAEARTRLAGAHAVSHHRFGAVLRGKLGPGQLQKLAESPAVLWIEPAPRLKLFDEISSKIVGGDCPGHATCTQESFFDGRGVTIAVADSGLHVGTAAGMHPDLAGRVAAFLHYGNLIDASDEHGHGTHVAGIIAGSGATGRTDEQNRLYGLGVAPGASLVVQRIFDPDGHPVDPLPAFQDLARDAVQAGADIGSNSWGDDTQGGRYDVSAMVFDGLVRDADPVNSGDTAYLLVFSAGNAGPAHQTIGSPAVAKNVIAAGASQSGRSDFFTYTEGAGAIASFSSRGPCEDGRIKPDVVAPGTWIASLRSPLGHDENAWLGIDDDYLYMGGTSQATPHVSGAAAVFFQYYLETYSSNPSPALVKAALIHSAVGLLRSSVDPDDPPDALPTPNVEEGWGRVDLTRLLRARFYDFLDQNVPLTNGQTYERRLIIAGDQEPLKITLAYTDVPGFPAALPALVNDLDLEVLGPDGRTYRGNQFEGGRSVPDAPGTDNLNNVEGVYLEAPPSGEYRVRVRARKVVEDALVGADSPNVDQDFALVISGVISDPETGLVLLDRERYTAPSRINIKLLDLDLKDSLSATVKVFSATEPTGQPVVLRPATSTGVLTGAIATATGPAAADGRLQIKDGDWIRVEYFDASESGTNVANAVADLVSPKIASVDVTNQFGQVVVSWLTDEAANSIIWLSSGCAPARALTNNVLTKSHELELTNLVPDCIYSFGVSSTDAAGNTATNNNGGALFTFVAVPTAPVLLVDAYLPAPGDPLVPLSAYTDALSQTGVTFDVWDATTNRFPTFANLRSYQIVMWRLNDSFKRSNDVILAAQQAALQQYLNSGGAFFMASMEIIQRLLKTGGGSFVTNVLHVQRFLRNTCPASRCPPLECDEDVGVPMAQGVPNDTVGDGIFLELSYANYPADDFYMLGPDFADTFGPSTNASPILLESVHGEPCGMRFPRTGLDSPGRVVFLSFPLDAISESDPAPNNRSAFLRRVFQFLAPGLNGLGTIALSQPFYKLPDLITLELADSDLAGQSAVTVNVHSSSAPSPISVTLRETTRPGLFRGFVPLVSDQLPPSSSQVRAREGDRIQAEYYDASGQITVVATATVDAVAPSILNPEAIPGYQDASVRWDTSEPTDALVQFGESAFLGRTAYVGDLRTNHTVQLPGLIPGRTYYYRVVSHDAAGNTTVDDNQGELYALTTLLPLPPPFRDDLENGGHDWSVFNGDDTQFHWQLGSPNNGQVASAPSPLNAWASNLLGDPTDNIDTTLVSPAIDLSGGNVATLTFSQAYDFKPDPFNDITNVGRLLIVTHSVSAPVVLAEYAGSNPGWRPEEIDLTPYLGQVIFLLWHDHYVASHRAYRAGWALDNIAVTVEDLPPGVAQITNNLAQARVLLAGPVNRVGLGYSTNFDDLPPGRYVATWNAVPYFLTPPPQTNLLTPGGLLVLTGNYSFPDENTNGISDLWETSFFGNVSPSRTIFTDTDQDGFPDYAEFVAGTNPTNAASYLRLLTPVVLTNSTGFKKLLLQWPAVPGRIYLVESTYDFTSWRTNFTWLQATTSTLSLILGAPDPSEPFVFRVDVRP